MDNNDLPEGWSMPDYMAKRISESINRKRITPEDELQDAFSDLANDLRLIEPDPSDWSWWVGYLLEQMEMEAQKRGKLADFIDMLRLLQTRTQTELESR